MFDAISAIACQRNYGDASLLALKEHSQGGKFGSVGCYLEEVVTAKVDHSPGSYDTPRSEEWSLSHEEIRVQFEFSIDNIPTQIDFEVEVDDYGVSCFAMLEKAERVGDEYRCRYSLEIYEVCDA